MKFCVDLLSSQSRKQLQAFAKANGIRANASNATIIESLLSLTSTISCGSPAVNIDASCTNEENEVVSIDEVLQVSDNPGHLEERGHGSSSSCAVTEEVEESGDTNHIDRQEWTVGSRVEASVDDVWTAGVIVKQNKKSYRVRFDSNNEESLIKCSNVRLATLGNSTLKDSSNDVLCSVHKVDEVAPTSAILSYSSSEFESEKVVNANAPQKSQMCDQNVALRRTGKSGGSMECKSSEKSHFGERQRSVGGTPIKSLSRPLFMPKSTKNQRVRLDASHLKRTTLSDLGSRKASIVCMPSIGNAQTSEESRTPLKSIASGDVTFRPPNLAVSSVTKARVNCLPSAKLSSPLRSTPSKLRNGVPNFQKMHQRLMSNLKPITEIVKRNQSVGSRMTAAMAEVLKSPAVAHVGLDATSSSHGPSTHSTKTLRATPPVAPGSLSNTKGATTLLPKTVPFKARVMPNFKALHSKIPVKTSNTPVADKENSCLPSNIGNVSRRLSVKDTKSFAVSKLNNRKEIVLKGRQEKREERVSLSRSAR